MTGGEESYLVTNLNWLGVADGVGHWSLEGIPFLLFYFSFKWSLYFHTFNVFIFVRFVLKITHSLSTHWFFQSGCYSVFNLSILFLCVHPFMQRFFYEFILVVLFVQVVIQEFMPVNSWRTVERLSQVPVFVQSLIPWKF